MIGQVDGTIEKSPSKWSFARSRAQNKKETLETALTNALAQIEEKKYEQELLDLGAADDNIIKYGFAFEGKKVLIGQG